MPVLFDHDCRIIQDFFVCLHTNCEPKRHGRQGEMAMAGARHHLERCRHVSYHHDGDRTPACVGQAYHTFLTDNGFRDYYKPADILFDACAEGRLLILSPWPYDSGKQHISRTDCVALNAMAEEIAEQGTKS